MQISFSLIDCWLFSIHYSVNRSNGSLITLIANKSLGHESTNARIGPFNVRTLALSNNKLEYEPLSVVLERNQLLTDAAEIHGILCGMLSGGMPLENRDWLEALADFINQGEPLADEVKALILALYDQTCQQLVEADFALVLCLPDDAAPINDRGQALINWLQGFMLGFGLHHADLTQCSADVKEALEDFSEIARMDEQMPSDEESEQALFEVMEYVRVSTMLCFNELGKSAADQQSKPKTIH